MGVALRVRAAPCESGSFLAAPGDPGGGLDGTARPRYKHSMSEEKTSRW
jgi:hypothetical protein